MSARRGADSCLHGCSPSNERLHRRERSRSPAEMSGSSGRAVDRAFRCLPFTAGPVYRTITCAHWNGWPTARSHFLGPAWLRKLRMPTNRQLWTMERSVAEVDAVVRALGLGRFQLFGNSWGGMLAQQYCSTCLHRGQPDHLEQHRIHPVFSDMVAR